MLPGIYDLAGIFLPDSGGNYFATMMTALCVPATADKWILQGPFKRWLKDFAEVETIDSETVLVWRDGKGTASTYRYKLRKRFRASQRSASLVRPTPGHDVKGYSDTLDF